MTLVLGITQRDWADAGRAAVEMAREAHALKRKETGGIAVGAAAGDPYAVRDSLVCEIPLARHLGLPWTGYIPAADLSKFVPDVGDNIDVKRATNPQWLHIKASTYPLGVRFVMALLHENTVEYLGWITAADGCTEEYWNEHAPRPCWSVPSNHLAPMEALT